MKEEWKEIPGYDGKYEVSNLGKVRNAFTGKHLSQKRYARYIKVYLYHDYTRKCYMLHRLVAEAFVENKDNKPQVNHIDGDRYNNRYDNLEWCTQSENILHSYRIGLRENNKKRLLETNHKCVDQLSMDGEYIRTWYSLSEAARQLGLSVSNICTCCKGRIHSTGGYKWRLSLEH